MGRKPYSLRDEKVSGVFGKIRECVSGQRWSVDGLDTEITHEEEL